MIAMIPFRKLAELCALILLCAGSGAFYALLPEPGGGREIVTLIYSVVLGLLFFVLLFLSFRRRTENEGGGLCLDRIFCTLTGIDAYIFLIPHVGYLCSTWLCLALFMFFLKTTKLLKILAIATLVTAALWLLFNLVLAAPTPRGFLF